MFGIPLSLYFIKSLLTITFFSKHCYDYYRESGRGRNMLQSFSLSFCLLFVLLVRCLVVRGFFGRHLMLSIFEELVTRQNLCSELFVWKFVQKGLAAKQNGLWLKKKLVYKWNTFLLAILIATHKKCLGHKEQHWIDLQWQPLNVITRSNDSNEIICWSISIWSY